jgi:predicted esterase
MVENSDFDPHASLPALARGPSPEKAKGTLILLHGRGASAQSILTLFDDFNLPDLAAIAPQARGHSWYPQSFLAPLQANQPFLDSALNRVESLVADLLNRGVAAEHIGVLGFSQGACLATEFAARHARRYGAVIAFTGGLIGPPGTAWKVAGSLEGTPVFLGSGDPDPHVPFARVEETAAVMTKLGAAVDLRRYPGMPHTINEEELTVAREMLERMIGGG